MKLLDTKKIYLTGLESVSVKDMIISGDKPRNAGKIGKNATVMFNTANLEITRMDATGVNCYNLIEQPYNVASQKIKKVEISGIKTGTGISHNVLNFYNLANGAEIIIKDSDFNLGKSSNVIRFDNLSEAKDVKIKFINCSWTYENSCYAEGDLEWMSLILLQPGAKAQQGKPTMGKENGWEINLKDCKYNGEKIWKATETADKNTVEDHISIVCIYDPGVAEAFPYAEKSEFIPKINIV